VSDSFVDTDVIIRLLAADDPAKQSAAARLFERVEAGELDLVAPDTMIADAVFVLSSRRLYAVPRAQIAAMLSALVRLPGFRVRSRHIVLRALELYATTLVDFGDAMIAAEMEVARAATLYSYDAHFDRFPWIVRQTP
jgi:predicted nucleic acid-binding protein